ncbi:MAG: hypothetical protein HQL50_15915 [Magnetococcales bacterium]|nr:hypothetical protein [Magnetococcales bacterium]
MRQRALCLFAVTTLHWNPTSPSCTLDAGPVNGLEWVFDTASAVTFMFDDQLD